MIFTEYFFVIFATISAGVINAMAGGGTLITFPVLMAVGLSSVSANVTNTIALCPGYFGGTIAQWNDIKNQRKRFFVIAPIAVLGGITGGLLLLYTGDKLFKAIVPFLILLASLLFAFQNKIKNKFITSKNSSFRKDERWGLIFLLIFPATIYGGYFGAGLGVILMAVLGLLFHDSVNTLNALKQATSFSTNISAAIFFLFTDKVNWEITIIMAVFALAGGWIGGRIAGRINPLYLRWFVICVGITVAILYWLRIF